MRRPIPSFASPEAPIHELNTTPLIDVMLVLLVMFIITIPLTTHKVPIDLPKAGPSLEKPVVHNLELDAASRIWLDGLPIGQAALPARLAAIADEPMSDLLLRADAETPYEHFDQVLALVKRAGITRMGMVGNEHFMQALDRPGGGAQ